MNEPKMKQLLTKTIASSVSDDGVGWGGVVVGGGFGNKPKTKVREPEWCFPSGGGNSSLAAQQSHGRFRSAEGGSPL